jgi:hypothetical protein
MRPMVWLTGLLAFLIGLGLLARGYDLLVGAVRSGVASFRIWSGEFWLARPGYPAMGLGENGRWAVHLCGGVAAMVLGWRLVRIAGRMD